MSIYLVYGVSDCPHCLRASALLMEKDLEYVFINMDFSKTYRDQMKAEWVWPTFPIVVKLSDDRSAQRIGGFEELKEQIDEQC